MAEQKAKGKGTDAAPAEPAAPAKKGGRKRLFIILGLALLVLGGGGAAAWFMLAPKPPADGAVDAPKPAPRTEKAKPSVFVALETFTVNLQVETSERYLQTSLSLKVADTATEQAIKQQMPEIRSRLLLLLSSKRPSELTTVEGKQALANQIAAEVNKTLQGGAAAPAAGVPAAGAPAEGPVQSVLFTNFIIQ